MHLPPQLLTLGAFAVALGVLVFVHEVGHFLVAKRVGVKVLRFSIGFGPILLARRRGETEYALSAMPLGGYVKMLGEEDEDEAAAEPARAFSTQRPLRRAAVVGAEVPSTQPRVGGVAAGSPAERAGLQVGDRIVAIDGHPIATWDALSQGVLRSQGARLTFAVERDGRQFTLEVTPELKTDRNLFGEEIGRAYRIGVEASHDWVRVGPLRAVAMAGEQTWSATAIVVRGLVLMARGRVPLRDLGGPIAIAQAAGQQARAGLRYFVSMLAFLSINLGVLNLLPIPALDGGHLALFAIEGALGHPLRQRHREIAQQVGLLLLLTLMVFVFYNDIHRLVQG